MISFTVLELAELTSRRSAQIHLKVELDLKSTLKHSFMITSLCIKAQDVLSQKSNYSYLSHSGLFVLQKLLIQLRVCLAKRFLARSTG
jgi:hypothetical protein